MDNNKQINPPDLTDVLNNLKTDIFNTINCINIGFIESFDPVDQTASVRVALKKVREVLVDGTRVIQERPILLKCPVVVMGGGTSNITFDIKAGDECVIFFNDREIDNWFATGTVSTPSSPRAHDASDAIAMVGIRSLQNSLQDYSESTKWSYGGDSIEIATDLITADADNFTHKGNLLVEGATVLVGNVTGEGVSPITINSDIVQQSGKTLSAGNGVTGTFTNSITVVDGIVTAGT